ncbi:MAG: CAF17-like 4Fe-4S cluster assembly/insertion protein YgfZ [Acidiferrobacterales bacterium]
MGSGNDWQAFMQQSGAKLVDGIVQGFGNPESERRCTADGDVVADLSHLSLIRADGEDASSFLQGQLSNDIRQVTDNHCQLSAYCSPQGRMFAIFRVFLSEGAYFLQLPGNLLTPTLNRMRMFVLRAKVRLECADAEWVRIGISGPNSEAILTQAGITPPLAVDGCSTSGDITILRIAGLKPRFELFARSDSIKALWGVLRTQVTPVSAAAWSWLDIVAGIPTVLPGTVEEFVPQMANLDLVDGINFKKGCYPGQEIVARMHYLGRLKQRMVRAHVVTTTPPMPGTAVFAPDFVGQSAGTVVDAQPGPEDGFDVLVVVQLSSLTIGEFHLAAPDGPRLKLVEMPYSLKEKIQSAGA